MLPMATSSSGHVDVDVTKPEVLVPERARDQTKQRLRRVDGEAAVRRRSRDGPGRCRNERRTWAARHSAHVALDDDPRFDGIDATVSTQAAVDVALAGPRTRAAEDSSASMPRAI